MNILFTASEMEPLAKTGGLADVVGILPERLKELGADVRVVIPYYREVKKNLKRLGVTAKNVRQKEVIVTIDWLPYKAAVREAVIDGITIYFLVNDELYDREFIYGSSSGDYPDNDVRFSFLSLGALELAKIINFRPDIVHCNDWQTAMLPMALKWKRHYNDDPFFEKTKVVFTIHNIAYQGVYPAEFIQKFGFPPEVFTPDELEFYGKVNLLKGGILGSDLVTTVSPRYAKEIQTPEYGYWLDGVLRSVAAQGKLTGIINGLNYDVWDPSTDEIIASKFDPEHIEGKKENKDALRAMLGFTSNGHKPLIGVVSRLADQKGIDLIVECLDDILGLGAELVVLGTGDKTYEKALTRQMRTRSKGFSAIIGYSDEKARYIYAGSDMFLMPSRFEPCGLGQLIALKYGSIPIVRATGGLMDSITDYRKDRAEGNGFVFEEFEGEDMIATIADAIEVYGDKNEWEALVKKAALENFSWRKSSRQYMDYYNRLLSV